jgi:biopolymer transport protein ExbD
VGADVTNGRGRPKPTINVTPLVDVVLVLLIIFMVIAPILERRMDVSIPTEQPADAAVDPPDQVLVEVAADGGIRLDDEAVALEALTGRIRERLIATDQSIVFFRVDPDALYGRAVSAMDAARAGGAETLGTIVSREGSGEQRR